MILPLALSGRNGLAAGLFAAILGLLTWPGGAQGDPLRDATLLAESAEAAVIGQSPPVTEDRASMLVNESSVPTAYPVASGTPREQTVLRLAAMYYLALAENRDQDAAALREAIDTLGGMPVLSRPVVSPPADGPAVTAGVQPTIESLLPQLREYVGLAVRVQAVGQAAGTVWGSDWYTDDSSVGAAAVHAGLAEPGESVEILLEVGGPRERFAGSQQRGVRTHDYGHWGGSFRLAPLEERPDVPVLKLLPVNSLTGVQFPVSVQDLFPRERRGEAFVTRLTGQTLGPVWGTDFYTTDSNLAAAAVHAGALGDGEVGLVKVTIEPGRSTYSGASRHGVTSSDWSSYPRSFRVERIDSAAAASETREPRRPSSRDAAADAPRRKPADAYRATREAEARQRLQEAQRRLREAQLADPGDPEDSK
jgi:hypothetical protein